jgi:demethylmenaquinone methyltransferase/2-methoxy-6-polyprenyl-1,4-benzoquinol methylase
MLTEARRTLGASVTCTQAVLEDFHPEQGYDVTLCAHVIEHCRSPAEAMRHLARITQPGGLIFLAVSRPHICQALIWFKWRHRWFSPETVTRMAQDAGLQNLETLSFERGVPARVSQGYVLRKPKGTDHADCTR